MLADKCYNDLAERRIDSISNLNSTMLKIDGKIIDCIECGNAGKPQGCEICWRKKSRDRIKFEQEQGYKIWLSRQPKEDQIRIRNEKREMQILAAAMQKAASRKENLSDFLQKLWNGLNKFQMQTTGDSEIDAKVREAHGDWL